jgi:pyridoxal phosphate enzyme (YggS family)
LHNSIENLISIENELKSSLESSKKVNIIAVSKTFSMQNIEPLISHGHIHFGENKVQEATDKWTEIKKTLPKIKLHMIGKLQTNKVKYTVPLFDYIHSLDSIKLAEKIAIEQKKKNKFLKIFIQVNIGDEDQKNGIQIKDLKPFFDQCLSIYKLDIVGLMCIPPNNENSSIYFSEMQKLNNLLGLKELSMGMSADYKKAIKFDSTYIRIGSKIFGNRN